MRLQEISKNHLAKEYRFAVTRMQQETQPTRKLYYFSVFAGEASRVLNSEWDLDLVLLYTVTQQVYTFINAQIPLLGSTIPIDASMIYEQLTKHSAELANYFEKAWDKNSNSELYQILGRLSEVGYLSGGNGAYLFEKGLIKF
ncbi:MAG: hypothetical protein ABR886_08500 [Dehalococcoidales bacterium]|jgi:hypothetical protein